MHDKGQNPADDKGRHKVPCQIIGNRGQKRAVADRGHRLAQKLQRDENKGDAHQYAPRLTPLLVIGFHKKPTAHRQQQRRQPFKLK